MFGLPSLSPTPPVRILVLTNPVVGLYKSNPLYGRINVRMVPDFYKWEGGNNFISVLKQLPSICGLHLWGRMNLMCEKCKDGITWRCLIFPIPNWPGWTSMGFPITNDKHQLILTKTATFRHSMACRRHMSPEFQSHFSAKSLTENGTFNFLSLQMVTYLHLSWSRLTNWPCSTASSISIVIDCNEEQMWLPPKEELAWTLPAVCSHSDIWGRWALR